MARPAKKFWLDEALDDGDPLANFGEQKPTSASSNSTDESDDDTRNVTINIRIPDIDMPDINWPKVDLPKWPYKKIAIITTYCLLILFLSLKLIGFVHHLKPAKLSTSQRNAVNVTSEKPSFALLFSTKQKQAGLSASNTAYDPGKKNYSYTDTIQGTNVTVSEQLLSDKDSTDKYLLQKAADSIGAQSSFDSTRGKVYLVQEITGTSEMVVFKQDKLLVFIRANASLGQDAWASYIEALSY